MTRPTLSTTTDADAVAADFVDVLQRGLDAFDADLYDSRFAQDLLWGSPLGRVLAGFADLNAAHRTLMSAGTGGNSRYELVQSLAPTDDVVLAHVRRASRPDPVTGDAPFSEMALYVLVRRDGAWWLAGGQNTIVAD